MVEIAINKNRLAFYVRKRRINGMFARLGLISSFCLLLLQVQTNSYQPSSFRPRTIITDASIVIEHFTQIILGTLANLPYLGGL
jgi:hypothetical protein